MKKTIQNSALLALFLTVGTSLHASSTIMTLDEVVNLSKRSPAADMSRLDPELAGYIDNASGIELTALLSFLASAEKPVVVKFYAEWCPPCKRLGPIMHEVAGIFGDKVTFVEINIEKFPEAKKFKVNAIPTLFFYNKGKEVGKAHFLSKDDFVCKINSFFGLEDK